MRHVAYVFQDSRLLKRSIADNLRIAKPDATEDEMMEALQKAQCMDIIERLPEIFERANVDPRRRGETLDKREFIQLGLALYGSESA